MLTVSLYGAGDVASGYDPLREHLGKTHPLCCRPPLKGFSAGHLCAEGSCGRGLFESSSNMCWLLTGCWGLHSMFLLSLYIFAVHLLMWWALAINLQPFQVCHDSSALPGISWAGGSPTARDYYSSLTWSLEAWQGVAVEQEILLYRGPCLMDLLRFGRDTWAGRIHPRTIHPSVLLQWPGQMPTRELVAWVSPVAHS